MKNVKLIDALPALFGMIALAGFVTVKHGNIFIGFYMLFIGAVLSLLTGVISVVFARQKRRFGRVHTLNTGIVLLLIGLIAVYVWGLITWKF
jgi:hypothetical protein